MAVKDFSDEIKKHLSGDLKEVTVEFNTDSGYMEVYIPADPKHKIPAKMWTDYNNAWRRVQDLSNTLEEYLKWTGQEPIVNDPHYWGAEA